MATAPHAQRESPRTSSTGDLLDRLPPQHLEAERGVIGSLLLDPDICDDMALLLGEFRNLLRARNAPLVLLPYKQHELHRQLRVRLIEQGIDLPIIPLLGDLLKEDTLGTDPHPAAETVRAMALWTAASLIDAELVPRARADGLPAVPSRFEGPTRVTSRSPRDSTPRGRWTLG